MFSFYGAKLLQKNEKTILSPYLFSDVGQIFHNY